MPNDEFWAQYRAQRAAPREPGTGRTILLGILIFLLAGWAVFGYLALLMTIFGIGWGGLAFGSTAAVIGLWVLIQRGIRPWWFRLVQAESFAEKNNWSCSKENRKTGSHTWINLELTGEHNGRKFIASQVGTETSTGEANSVNDSYATVVRLSANAPNPVDSVEFRRLTGRITVRYNRHPDLARAVERSDFARWLRGHRLLGRGLRYVDGTITARWSGGMYGAKLLRRLRFLEEADARLRAAAQG